MTCWIFLTNKNFSKKEVAAIMGNLYCESTIKSIIYEESYHNTIGLTNEDYVKMVNNGSYTNFINDKVGFGLAQWTYHTRKKKTRNV